MTRQKIERVPPGGQHPFKIVVTRDDLVADDRALANVTATAADHFAPAIFEAAPADPLALARTVIAGIVVIVARVIAGPGMRDGRADAQADDAGGNAKRDAASAPGLRIVRRRRHEAESHDERHQRGGEFC